MSQINLLIIELLICFITLLLLYKKYDKMGIYAYSAIAMILTSIMSLKTITLYEYDINLGIIPYVTIFTATNILIQKKGQEESKTLLLTTIASFIISYIILYSMSYTTSSNFNLFTSASYDNIFKESIRTYFATFVTTLYSLLLDIKLYYYLKKVKNNIFISSLFSTIIIHFVSAILFGIITGIFTKDILDIIKIIMIRYLASLCIGILSTVVIFITKYIKQKE